MTTMMRCGKDRWKGIAGRAVICFTTNSCYLIVIQIIIAPPVLIFF